MPTLPDTSIVNLHRTAGGPVHVDRVDGPVWRIREGSEQAEPLEVGDHLEPGDTVALGAAAQLEAGSLRLRGGDHGQAHALVKEGAFRPNPSRADVPRLLLQLAQIEEQMGSAGEDPLAVRQGPETDFERAASSDFARCNLVLAAARELPETVARAERAVCLFVNEDTAFVAVTGISVAKLRALMEALGRPVNPHMVEEAVLDELLDRAYGLPN
ncbi:MAG: hypothetical protein AAFZ18_05495 [Myxococcota bacterium]